MKRRTSFLIFCSTVLFLIARAQDAPPPSDATSDQNFIRDSGFEDEQIPPLWTENNWAKNDVEFERDDKNPHSGQRSERVTLRHVTGMRSSLQLVYPNLAITAGASYQLRFWLRGLSNTKPIRVSIRQNVAPYKTYFSRDVALSNGWTESAFNITLPSAMEPNTALIFELQEENTFWVDDVTLKSLPPADDGPELVGNQIKNGSFEVGRDHWFATFRPDGAHSDSPPSAQVAATANIVAQPEPDSPDGHNVLAFEVFPTYRIFLTSSYFHLRYGHPVSVNFWLKSSVSGTPFRIELGQGKFPDVTGESHDLKASDDKWQFYHTTITPKASTSGTYYFVLEMDHPAQYQLDAVSIVEGDSSDQAYPKDKTLLGWDIPPETPPGNVFYAHDAIHFPLKAVASAGSGKVPVHLRLVDYQEREIKQWDVTVDLDANGYGQKDVVLPSEVYGGFKVEAFLGDSTDAALPKTDLIYCVVEHLKPPAEAPDSFFGSHVYFTPYNLAIAQRVGFRWLRLHPPLVTKWMSVEPKQGTFVFDTDGVALASKMGFHLLGSFDTAPWFYSDDPEAAKKSSWYDSYGPGDWDAWRTYVQKTAVAFSPYITNWEIWNEPDGGFLNVPAGVDKPQLYVQIVTETRKALEQAGLKEFLVGNAVAHLEGPFTMDELKGGGGAQVDALSFHLYQENQGPEEKQPPLADQFEAMRKFPNYSGKEPQLWDTEGGIWLNDGPTWMTSTEIPTTVTTTVEDAANTIVRTVAALKAMGVSRHFYYAAGTSLSGGADFRCEAGGMIAVNGDCLPSAASHAAAVYFLEDAVPLGLEEKKAGAALVACAKFKNGGNEITVVWSRQTVSLGDVPGLPWSAASAYDLMGNPISLSASTKVTLDPIYLINKSASP